MKILQKLLNNTFQQEYFLGWSSKEKIEFV